MLLLALSCSYSTARFIPPGETVDLRDFESQFKCVVRLVISVIDGTELCGTGALMMAGTEWFVLTAAHLFVGDTYTFKDGDSLEVSGGSRAMKYAHTVTFALMKPTDEPQPWRQAVVYLPPDYDARRSRGAYDQDIAIIWLRGEFDALKTASDVDAATTKLHGEDVPIGQIVEVYGFGQDEMRGGQYQVIECSGGLPSTGFCYVPMRKINLYPVHGDSGAPIMCRDDTASSRAICGVHIGGYDADNSLQVGTKLTSYIQWFTETVLLCRFYSVTRPLPPVILVPSESETNRTSLQLSGGGGVGLPFAATMASATTNLLLVIFATL
uniref:Peptidase S1 domain-containing protein n=1 Tax=Plectus sambesii TaxID=2011161 RepID=A0A914VLQ7_9BILA